MFILSEISDLIRIPPSSFNVPIELSLKDELHQKYSNKIIANLGLAICVWDILDIKDGLLKPGDGGSYVEVCFRMMMWKPFRGEILTGWITECNAKGIKVRTAFFDEIWIPKEFLFENCEYRESENVWVYLLEENELFLDVDEKIRFRVEEELFYNVKPKVDDQNDEETEEEKAKNVLPPYSITASCQDYGMGCVEWW
ncbi:RPC25 DNA-directed RNA polymerase III subunit RPC8 [Candida maltosa Xu316]